MPNYGELAVGELQGLVSQGDHEAYYWLGMAYWERGDFAAAVEWLEKTMNDPGNEWAAKATNNLALLHENGDHPNADRDEAVRLYETIDSYAMAKIHLGFLYYLGTPTRHSTGKGLALVEAGVSQLKAQNNGSDDYLSQIECYTIGEIYSQEKNTAKAKEYFNKAIRNCSLDSPHDQALKKVAEEDIRKLELSPKKHKLKFLWVILAITTVYFAVIGYLVSIPEIAPEVPEFLIVFAGVCLLISVILFIVFLVRLILFLRRKLANMVRKRRDFEKPKKMFRTIAIITEIGAVILFIIGVYLNTSGFDYGFSQFAPMIPLVLVIGFVFYRIAFKPKSAFSFIAMLVFLYGSVFLLYGSFVDLQTEQFMAYNSASGPFILIIAALANAIASFLAYVCADASESKVLTSGTWWALFGVFASLAIAGAYELEGLMIGLAAVSFVFALIFSLASRSSSIDHRPRMNHSSLSDAERDAIRRQLFYGSPTGGPSYRDYMDDSGSQYGTGSETSSSSFLSKEGGNTSTIVSPAGYVRDIYGNQTGRVEGGVIRDVYGNQIGRIEGRIIRDAHGNHTGTFENGKLRDIYGNYLGELRGNCFYDADGNHQGSVE